MVLDGAELRDLAVFLAKRFPDAQSRRGIAARAGVGGGGGDDAVAGWTAILEGAQRTGSFAGLAKALSAAAPGDTNLQEACAILRPATEAGGTPRWVLLAGVVLGISVVVAGVRWAMGDEPGSASTGQPASASTGQVVSASTGEAASASAVEAASTGQAASTTKVEPVAASPVVTSPVVTPPVATALVATPAVATRPARGGCTGDVGSIVGWWYSGATSPGSQGATFTLDRDARVRADYPRTENHNDPHAPERCVLPRGGQYTLSHAPVEASPGHWWVPYAVGD